MVLAQESFVLACFLRISKHNVWILLQLLPMRTHARIQNVLSEGVQLCNSDNVFFFSFFFRGERIQISLKSGHHRPASETPFNVECWLGSFENCRGSGPVLLKCSIFL